MQSAKTTAEADRLVTGGGLGKDGEFREKMGKRLGKGQEGEDLCGSTANLSSPSWPRPNAGVSLTYIQGGK